MMKGKFVGTQRRTIINPIFMFVCLMDLHRYFCLSSTFSFLLQILFFAVAGDVGNFLFHVCVSDWNCKPASIDESISENTSSSTSSICIQHLLMA